MTGLLRHIAACNNAVLPGRRQPLRIAGETIGYVLPETADALSGEASIGRDDAGLVLRDPAELPAIARRLAARGFGRHRGEAFDVRASPAGPVLATIDRGALPVFGVQAQGVHLDALVHRPGGRHIWIARRAADKALDPGKLDHVVAGGIPSGLGPAETLVKEAAEEAAMPATLARMARPVGTVFYAMDRGEGLRRDLLHCYEVEVPEDFTPVPTDGEVAGFECWPLSRVLETVRDTDDFKFNVNLVLLALFLRHGLLTGAEAAAVRAGLAGLGTA